MAIQENQKNQRNKVTGYAKLWAVVLGVLVLSVGFYLSFYWGSQWGKEKVDESADNDNDTTEQLPAQENTPTITTKTFKEENFSGSRPVISGTGLLALSARAYIDKTIAEFKIEADNLSSNYTIDIGAKYFTSNETESLALTISTYTGGAHGSSYYKVFTGSRTSGKISGKILTLSDLIKPDQQNAFTQLVKNKLNSWRPEGSSASVVFPEDVKALTFNFFENWALDDKNLYIYFDQYAIGPGALGPVAFPIRLQEIITFLIK